LSQRGKDAGWATGTSVENMVAAISERYDHSLGQRADAFTGDDTITMEWAEAALLAFHAYQEKPRTF
jgi:hypothetical protein